LRSKTLKAAEAGLPDVSLPERACYQMVGQGAWKRSCTCTAVITTVRPLKANEVIQSGKYDLFPNYGEMFTTSKDNNNIESLFSLQWLASGGYSYANAIQAYCGPSTLLGPDFKNRLFFGDPYHRPYQVVRNG